VTSGMLPQSKKGPCVEEPEVGGVPDRLSTRKCLWFRDTAAAFGLWAEWWVPASERGKPQRWLASPFYLDDDVISRALSSIVVATPIPMRHQVDPGPHTGKASASSSLPRQP
jgi:hypothetical protein